jgi:hypothetical protein
MNKLLLVLALLTFGLIACESDIKEGEQLVEISGSGENSNLIRNELTADEPVDTVNTARIVFDTPVYDFGEVKEGEKVSYSFEFENIGNKSLVIKDARSTCGCTIPEKPKEAIAPGEKGEIPVIFNSTGKEGKISKVVTITSNAYPTKSEVLLTGYVISEE